MLSTKNANRWLVCIMRSHLFILFFLASWGCYDIAMVYNHTFHSSHHSFAFVRVTHSWEQKHGGCGGFVDADLPLLENWIAEPSILLCVMQILSSREFDYVTNSCLSTALHLRAAASFLFELSNVDVVRQVEFNWQASRNPKNA